MMQQLVQNDHLYAEQRKNSAAALLFCHTCDDRKRYDIGQKDLKTIFRLGKNAFLKNTANIASAERQLDILPLYKAVYLLGKITYPSRAKRLFKWVWEFILREDPDTWVKERSTYDGYMKEFTLYPLGWLTMAAIELGISDISYKLYQTLLAYFDNHAGAFFTNVERDTYDIITNAHLGLLSMQYGRTDIAEMTGKFLESIMEDQGGSHRLLLRRDTSGALLDKAPEKDSKLIRIDSTIQGQDYFHLGYAISYLSKLFSHTGNRRFLNSAIAYADFVQKCRMDVFEFPGNRKIAWGLSCLWARTEEIRYYKALSIMLENMISSQYRDGLWRYRKDSGITFSILEDYNLDLTSETMIVLLDVMHELKM